MRRNGRSIRLVIRENPPNYLTITIDLSKSPVPPVENQDATRSGCNPTAWICGNDPSGSRDLNDRDVNAAIDLRMWRSVRPHRPVKGKALARCASAE